VTVVKPNPKPPQDGSRGKVPGSNWAEQIWTRGAHVGPIHYIYSNRIIRNGSGAAAGPVIFPDSVVMWAPLNGMSQTGPPLRDYRK
jgi:hypothetical protein